MRTYWRTRATCSVSTSNHRQELGGSGEAVEADFDLEADVVDDTSDLLGIDYEEYQVLL